jgi:demethylmenaquinone methyltransferase/2-methoxy-6-polyprenyl-1,4-benzoquinol methylase
MESEAIWRREGEGKRAAVRGMFADIARGYDRMNGLMSFGLHHRWRAFAVRQLWLHEGQRVLDVCCGTGDFMLSLRKEVGSTGQVFGVDFCLPMLEGAQEKLRAPSALPPAPSHRPTEPSQSSTDGAPRRREGESSLALGDACRLPVASDAFDGVSVGWGLRNVPDLDAALGEAYRVLKKGGRFVSLDMARPRNPIVRKAAEFALRRALPLLGKLLRLGDEAYAYLPESTLRFASRETLAAAMERAGFVDVAYRDLMLGNLCVHWGRKP